MATDPTAEALALCDAIEPPGSDASRKEVRELCAHVRALGHAKYLVTTERDRLRASLLAVERENARWRGCEPVEGDYACGHAAEAERLRAELAEARRLIHASGLWKTAPCRICGYNGPDYYKPEVHKCAGPAPDAAKENRP